VRELPYLLAGAEMKQASGEIRVGGQSQPSVPVAGSQRTRLPFVPGDREAEGVIAGFTVQENLSLSILDTLRSGIGIDAHAERRTATQWLERFAVAATSGAQSITALSGGNQQKVVMARCLATDSPVIVMCEPTAGVDIGARQSIHAAIIDESRTGRSFVIASADIDDLLGVCTRIIVLRDGRIAEQLTGTQIEKSNLLEIIERREDTDG
jgi:ABC-type sugar transport system ATPase subunit